MFHNTPVTYYKITQPLTKTMFKLAQLTQNKEKNTDSNNRLNLLVVLTSVALLSGCGGNGSEGLFPAQDDGLGSSGSPPDTVLTPSPDPTPVIRQTSTPSPTPSSAPVVASPPDNLNVLDTPQKSAAFLIKASFGNTIEDIESWVGRDAAEWIKNEFAKPRRSHVLAPLVARDQIDPIPTNGQYHVPYVWESILDREDQLRQRMIFALSQIIVAADQPMSNQSLEVAYYIDQLSKNSFGNYRQLLEDITYSNWMARYLSYMGNRKGDPATGRRPDENYAREIMQLFSIGLVELNMDGTPKLDNDGNEIETYTNDDVVGLARVFTGLYSESSDFGNFRKRVRDFEYLPLKMFEEQHSKLEKTFLGLTIPADTNGTTSIEMALDHIFAHPNVAPFISRILIQRFTATHPSKDYVERVANAFESGLYTSANGTNFGDSQRGNLRATIAAILLDREVHSDTNTTTAFGKIREPVLNFAHWVRAMKVKDILPSNEFSLNTGRGAPLGQQPFRSPSVFNFYRPGYVAPSTESGARNLTAPELQLFTPVNIYRANDALSTFIYNRSSRIDRDIDSFTPEYEDEIALADNPAELVDHLDLLLTAGRLTQDEKNDITEAVTATVLRDDSNRQADITSRVQLAVNLVMLSPNYIIIR